MARTNNVKPHQRKRGELVIQEKDSDTARSMAGQDAILYVVTCFKILETEHAESPQRNLSLLGSLLRSFRQLQRRCL